MVLAVLAAAVAVAASAEAAAIMPGAIIVEASEVAETAPTTVHAGDAYALGNT